MKKILNHCWVYLTAVLLVIADQVIKLVVINNNQMLPKVIINGFLKFTYCENRGVAFSLGDGNVTLFVIINIVMILGLILFYEKEIKKYDKISKTFISMIIAGGISNLIDRMFRGFVVDFIDINDFFNFAIFNVADIFICLGVIGLGIWYIFKCNKEK